MNAAAATQPVAPPRHTTATTLRLIGASAEGVAVEQGGPTPLLLTGTEGKPLTPRPFGHFIDSTDELFGVDGPYLAWGLTSFSSVITYEAYTMNLATGESDFVGETGRPLAFSTRRWLSTGPLTRSAFPFDPTDLHELTPQATDPPSFADRTIGMIRGLRPFAADDTWAVNAWTDRENSGNHLDLISLADGTHERIADSATPIESVAVGYGQIAWITRTGSEAPTLHLRAVAGGPVTDRPDPDVPRSNNTDAPIPLVVGASGAAYLTTTRHGVFLRRSGDDGVRSVELPTGSAGLAAVGDRFLTAAGGGPARAGVYAVDPDDRVRRTTTVPEREFTPTSPVLDTGRLYWTDDSAAPTGSKTLWSRRVSGRAPVRLTDERRLPAPVSAAYRGPAVNHAVSAGRTVLLEPGARGVAILDRGRPTGRVATGRGTLNISGPYVAVGDVIRRPGGGVLYRPARAHPIGSLDLFGSRLVYTRVTKVSPSTTSSTASSTVSSSVWLDDARHPHPRKLRNEQTAYCGSGRPVSIWADTVAWVNCGRRTITVRNLRTGTVRQVPTRQASQYTRTDIQLAEGTLA